MFTAQQYRTKAVEYGRLLEMARSPAETSEYRDLHQSYSLLAENLDWLTTNAGKVIVSNQPHAPNAESRDGLARQAEEERINDHKGDARRQQQQDGAPSAGA
jgi:hypothetical protein